MERHILKSRIFLMNFFLAASILTAIMIFLFSAQEGPQSAELSEGVTLSVAKVVRPDFQQLPPMEKKSFLDKLGTVVRKCAHFSEYALLGFNLAFFFRLKLIDKSMKRAAVYSIAWITATLYAATDELHQMFVAQRGPALLDVCIDSSGAIIGVCVAALLAFCLERTRVRALLQL